ncbi:hypothetical protein BRC83_09455 [Halobacteriales archaeon QS_1_68_17]|nr:MAG: hypothetical protein BRC83_09455 [Halobacteriales archaeon QS_1_68_17]
MPGRGLGVGWLALVAASVVVAAALFPAGVAASAPPETVFPQQDAPGEGVTNNTTVRHERPENISESGDSEQVARWLTGRLGDRFAGSTVQLSQGEYEQARALPGDEYDDRLEQYVDVAGDTADESDDETADQFRNAQRTQRKYVRTVESYERTYRQYRETKRRGNESAARRHVRRLERRAANVSRLNESLTRSHGRLGNLTGIDTTPARSRLTNVTTNVTARQTEVREETFVRTRLRVSNVGPSPASPLDPLVLRGRLVRADGTPVADRPVRLRVGNRSLVVRTDSTGVFEDSFRPVALPAGTSTQRVAYVPRDAAPFLGANDTVRVSVRQVTPNLTRTGRRWPGRCSPRRRGRCGPARTHRP